MNNENTNNIPSDADLLEQVHQIVKRWYDCRDENGNVTLTPDQRLLEGMMTRFSVLRPLPFTVDALQRQVNQLQERLDNAFEAARELIEDHDIDRSDRLVKRLVQLGMDGFTSDRDVTVNVTFTLRFTVDEVPDDIDETDFNEAVNEALDEFLSVCPDVPTTVTINNEGYDVSSDEVDDLNWDDITSSF